MQGCDNDVIALLSESCVCEEIWTALHASEWSLAVVCVFEQVRLLEDEEEKPKHKVNG